MTPAAYYLLGAFGALSLLDMAIRLAIQVQQDRARWRRGWSDSSDGESQ